MTRDFECVPIGTSNRLRELEEALRRIAGMTDIEADFDGFEARETARIAIAAMQLLMSGRPERTPHD